MARLFITERELNFIADITKELNKDIVGEDVLIYRVREDLSEVHDVYEESMEKIFDPPIKITARVKWNTPIITTNHFGHDEKESMEFYLHQRDILDKDLLIRIGDYCQYGSIFYEITSVLEDTHVYGQIEHVVGIKCVAHQARDGQILKKLLNPTVEGTTPEEIARRKTFYQQRGFDRNQEGETGDVRQLQKDGKLEPPLTGPAEISPLGDDIGITSAFYGDDE